MYNWIKVFKRLIHISFVPHQFTVSVMKMLKLKTLYLMPGSKLVVPGSISKSPNLKWHKFYNIYSVIWLREVSNRRHFSLENSNNWFQITVTCVRQRILGRDGKHPLGKGVGGGVVKRMEIHKIPSTATSTQIPNQKTTKKMTYM